MRRILVIIVALFALAVPASALAHGGPQPLPGAACNQGTANAHTSLGENAAGHDRIPHDHGSGCVHFNPTASH